MEADRREGCAIRAVIFDFSGVILDQPPGRRSAYIEEVARRYGISEKALKNNLERRGLSELSARGLSTVIHQPLADLLGRSVEPLPPLPRRDERPNPAHLEIVEALPPRYRTAILANSNGTVETRMTALGIRGLFDAVIDSDVAGVRKPNLAIYLLAASAVGCRPDECLFIDNRQNNVDGALAAGMRAALFKAGRGPSLAELLTAHGVMVHTKAASDTSLEPAPAAT